MMTADKLAPLLYKAWNPNGAPWEALTASTRAAWRAVAAEALRLLRREPLSDTHLPPKAPQVPSCAMRGKGCVMNEVTPCPTCGCVMVRGSDVNTLRCSNCQYVSLPDEPK